MPILGVLLMNIIGFLANFLTRFFSVRVAFAIAAWTSILAGLAVLVASLYSCVDGVCADAVRGLGTISPSLGMGFGIAWNSVTVTAFSCYFTVWLLCQVYKMKVQGWKLLLGSA